MTVKQSVSPALLLQFYVKLEMKILKKQKFGHISFHHFVVIINYKYINIFSEVKKIE